MSRLTLDRLGKRYGRALAVDGVSLDIANGEMVVLLGPSGCGKTTTLRMVAGFVPASAGDVRLDGASILGLPPHRRDMGLVFQGYALFPHMTVAGNVAFGLEMRGVAGPARDARVAEMLRLTRIEALAQRLPRQLSGGQQQRVALARALAIRPRVLLLDEPLSNLDAALRAEVGRDIRLLQRASGLTTVMVTHDQDEAMAMADRLVVMQDGRVQQCGTQEDLYERPATPFVAGFIGRSNMVPGTLVQGGAMQGGAVLAEGARAAAGRALCRGRGLHPGAAARAADAGARRAGRTRQRGRRGGAGELPGGDAGAPGPPCPRAARRAAGRDHRRRAAARRGRGCYAALGRRGGAAVRRLRPAVAVPAHRG